MYITVGMIEKFLVRFVIGVSASYLIVWLAKKY